MSRAKGEPRWALNTAGFGDQGFSHDSELHTASNDMDTKTLSLG